MRNSFLITAAATILLQACQSNTSAPAVKIQEPVTVRINEPVAADYLREAELIAASLSTDISQSNAFSRYADLVLSATKLFVAQNDIGLADDTLTRLDPFWREPTRLNRDQINIYHRLRATIALAQSRLEQALEASKLVSSPGVSDWRLRADICSSMRDFVCAANNLIDVQEQTGEQTQNEAIWQALKNTDELPKSDAMTPLQESWWALRREVLNGIDATPSAVKQRMQWLAWRQTNFMHPAAQNPPQQLLRLETYRPKRLAILLPLSGDLGYAGQAVRDGYLAAYLTDRAAGSQRINKRNAQARQPTVTSLLNTAVFYDTESAPIAELFGDALEAGADLIVGPLLKERAERLASLAATTATPTLLLNYLDSSGTQGRKVDPQSTPQIMQLGATIEDEAKSLIEALGRMNHENVLIISNNQGWAYRANSVMASEWPYALTNASFNNLKELTGAVGRSMQVAASEERHRKLAALIEQPLEFLARARKDLDAIVALTDHQESLALLPVLQFHFAEGIPVYATSLSARGQQLEQLAGFNVTEIPLLAKPDTDFKTLQQLFPITANPIAELYALGFDAYRISTWLDATDSASPHTSFPYNGALGQIKHQPDGKLIRKLKLKTVRTNGTMATTIMPLRSPPQSQPPSTSD